jgi:hypothetical protein
MADHPSARDILTVDRSATPASSPGALGELDEARP